MKKMTLFVSVVAALIFASCAVKTNEETVATDSTNVETIAVIDSVVVDSVYTVAE